MIKIKMETFLILDGNDSQYWLFLFSISNINGPMKEDAKNIWFSRELYNRVNNFRLSEYFSLEQKNCLLFMLNM